MNLKIQVDRNNTTRYIIPYNIQLSFIKKNIYIANANCKK